MFNFQNLNDYEFEVLAKNILEKETEREYSNFAKGRDGGIDIATYESDGVFAQAKHYLESNLSSLITGLKNELPKIKKLNATEYYIFTSKQLSSSKISELYEHFIDYMETNKNIYDRTRINALLQKEEYKSVVRNHYKLWLTSTNILEEINNQHQFIDTEVLLNNIDEESKRLVDTSAYYDSLSVLERERVVIIQGQPGVGKTTISKMLLLHYASEKYNVKYVSDGSIKDIKKSLSINRNLEEIVLIDDFLGQHYLSINEKSPNEIKSLIAYIKANKAKKLILNTRVTILNEAERRFPHFNFFIEDSETSKYMIDIDKMDINEKGKILYNHLYFKNIPCEYFENIRQNRRYQDIIIHPNYNPRIIDFVTRKKALKKINSSSYYDYIMDTLRNPTDVWNEEFEERISPIDRILMYCLYSITDNFVNYNKLEECFNFWVSNKTIDYTIEQFESSLTRLTDSMLRLASENKKVIIGTINPSINDYIFHKLSKNNIILKRVLSNSKYVQQIDKMQKVNTTLVDQYIEELLVNGDFLLLKTNEFNIEYLYIRYVSKLGLECQDIKATIHRIVSSKKTYSNIENELLFDWFGNEIIEFIISLDNYIFYDLDELLFDTTIMKPIIETASFDNLKELMKFYLHIKKTNMINAASWEDFMLFFESYSAPFASDKIKELSISEINDDIFDEINSTCDSFIDNSIEFDIFDISTEVEDSLKIKLEAIINKKTKEIMENNIDVHIDIDIDTYELINELNIYSEVDSYISTFNNSDKSNKNDIDNKSKSIENFDEIDLMFSRTYNPK